MAYEKLSLDRFILSMKEGKYESLSSARKSISKTSSWNDAEKSKAQAAALKHFGGEGAAPTKKIAKTAKKAGKKAAKTAKVAKTAAKAAPAARQPRAPRTPVTSEDAPRVVINNSTVGDADTLRFHSATNLVTTLMGRSSLSPLEQELLAIGQAESKLYASPAARAAVAPPAPAVVAPPASAPRIDVPTNGTVDLGSLTASERLEHDRLTESAKRTGFPIPTARG